MTRKYDANQCKSSNNDCFFLPLLWEKYMLNVKNGGNWKTKVNVFIFDFDAQLFRNLIFGLKSWKTWFSNDFRGIEIYEFAQISLILKGKLGEGPHIFRPKSVLRQYQYLWLIHSKKITKKTVRHKAVQSEQCKHYKNVHRRFASVFAADFMVF